jgi:hypothetical protein
MPPVAWPKDGVWRLRRIWRCVRIVVRTHMVLTPLAAQRWPRWSYPRCPMTRWRNALREWTLYQIQCLTRRLVLGAGPNILPSTLHGYTGGDVDTVQWCWAGAGIRQYVLPVSGQAKARLLRIPAGASAPEHGHCGAEMTIVLGGSFLDGGDIYRRGDVQETGRHTDHSPMAGPEAPCVCLVVTDAPLKFWGLGPRLAQRFNRL